MKLTQQFVAIFMLVFVFLGACAWIVYSAFGLTWGNTDSGFFVLIALVVMLICATAAVDLSEAK